MAEKKMAVDQTHDLTIQPTNNQDLEDSGKELSGVDPALKYTDAEVIEFSAEEESSVLKKIDRHLLPLLVCFDSYDFLIYPIYTIHCNCN